MLVAGQNNDSSALLRFDSKDITWESELIELMSIGIYNAQFVSSARSAFSAQDIAIV